MGNDSKLIRAVIESGQNQGEAFWELPLPAEYKELFENAIRRSQQHRRPRRRRTDGRTFLQEFIPEGTTLGALDIAGPFIREKEWKYYEAGGIGFGLKTLVDLAERFNDYAGIIYREAGNA